MGLIKTLASWDDLVIAPSVQSPRGCVCMTCGRLVDEEGVVEGYPAEPGGWYPEQQRHADGTFGEVRQVYRQPQPGSPTAKWLVRHHGAEELRTFVIGSTWWQIEDVARMARRTNWFDPTRLEGLGLGKRIDNPGEHDDIDEPKAFSLPSGGGPSPMKT